MPRNEGHLPPETVIYDDDGNVTGSRAVHVVLFGGFDTKKAGAAPWPAAGGRPPTRWGLGGHPYDIVEFDLA